MRFLPLVAVFVCIVIQQQHKNEIYDLERA